MSSNSNFGELVLVVGDVHIPDRAGIIAAPIQRMLVPNKMQHVICTGNTSQEIRDTVLQPLSPHLHCVRGDYDTPLDTMQSIQQSEGRTATYNCDASALPDTIIVQVGSFRIGVLHGHQLVPWKCPEAKQRMRRKLQVDILITGHTHQNEVVVDEDGFCYINPVRNKVVGRYVLLC